MRGLLLAASAAGVIFLAWSYQGVVAVPADALHSVAGIAVASTLGWIVLCVLLTRAIAVGGAASDAPRRR
jgi:hypothetical protein